MHIMLRERHEEEEENQMELKEIEPDIAIASPRPEDFGKLVPEDIPDVESERFDVPAVKVDLVTVETEATPKSKPVSRQATPEQRARPPPSPEPSQSFIVTDIPGTILPPLVDAGSPQQPVKRAAIDGEDSDVERSEDGRTEVQAEIPGQDEGFIMETPLREPEAGEERLPDSFLFEDPEPDLEPQPPIQKTTSHTILGADSVFDELPPAPPTATPSRYTLEPLPTPAPAPPPASPARMTLSLRGAAAIAKPPQPSPVPADAVLTMSLPPPKSPARHETFPEPEPPSEPELEEPEPAVILVPVQQTAGKPIQFGVITGRAKEYSQVVLRVPLGRRLGPLARARLECNFPGLTVGPMRAGGTMVDITVQIDAKHSFQSPIKITFEEQGFPPIVAEGDAVIARPEPYILGLTAVVGGSSSRAPPIGEAVREVRNWVAFWDPKLPQFWVTKKKGTIQPGMKDFPTRVVFAARDQRPQNNLLVFDLGDSEITIRVFGSVPGFEGRRRGERQLSYYVE
jgi:hypothetical protein